MIKLKFQTQKMAAVLSLFAQEPKWKFTEIKNVLVKPNRGATPSNVGLKKPTVSEMHLVRLLKQLCKDKKLKKAEDGAYELNKNYFRDAMEACTQATDLVCLQTYRPDDIITTTNVTFYGLKKDVFAPLVKGTINLDVTEESIKWRKLRDKFQELLKQTDCLKREHRLRVLTGSYSRHLKAIKQKRLRMFLKRHSVVFINFLNSTDMDEAYVREWVLKRNCHIFCFRNKLLHKKGKWYTELVSYNAFGVEFSISDVREFLRQFNKLLDEEKESLVQILLDVVKPVEDLYPTNVMVVCKTNLGVFAPYVA